MSELAARLDAIVIGASAGGVESLSTLLPAIPASTRAAVFVVLHLPREHKSLLSEIFGASCAISVKEAEDKEPVRPATVYFAPPDYHLLIDTGPQIALSVDEPLHFSRPSIDVLFESAAECYGSRLLGVILTGASRDGAAGLAAVKAAGGVTAVQTPGTTQQSMMANAALSFGPADFVLPVPQLAQLFATLGVDSAH